MPPAAGPLQIRAKNVSFFKPQFQHALFHENLQKSHKNVFLTATQQKLRKACDTDVQMKAGTPKNKVFVQDVFHFCSFAATPTNTQNDNKMNFEMTLNLTKLVSEALQKQWQK